MCLVLPLVSGRFNVYGNETCVGFRPGVADSLPSEFQSSIDTSCPAVRSTLSETSQPHKPPLTRTSNIDVHILLLLHNYYTIIIIIATFFRE